MKTGSSLELDRRTNPDVAESRLSNFVTAEQSQWTQQAIRDYHTFEIFLVCDIRYTVPSRSSARMLLPELSCFSDRLFF